MSRIKLPPETIRVRLKEINDARGRALATFRATMQKLDEREKADVFSCCPHVWEKLSDPAGGPGYRVCEICNKDFTSDDAREMRESSPKDLEGAWRKAVVNGETDLGYSAWKTKNKQ